MKCEKGKRKEINFFSFNTNPNRDRDGLTELNQSRNKERESTRDNFERRMYAELSSGLARNVNEISINARIDAVTSAYNRDGFAFACACAFAESNKDVVLLSGAGDNNSDDE